MNFKNIGIALVALVLGATLGVAGLHSISAATNGQSTLIGNLAKKFNSSTSDVKAVFDQTRSDLEAERQKEIEDSLTQAVKDGKITESQKSTILSKLANIKKQMDEARNASKDLKNWADDNKVDLGNILPGREPFGRGHRGF